MKTLNIVKIGGQVIQNASLLKQFLKEFARLDAPKILVHGGGQQASNLAQKLGIEVKMHQGRRITDQATLDIVTMVYGGLINNQITAQLQQLGAKALGVSGADLGVITAQKRAASAIDYGYVGDIQQIDASLIVQLIQQNITLVFAPLTSTVQGQLLNTNADTIAAQLAIALQGYYQVKLHYCFEQKGVLSNLDDPDTIIPTISPQQLCLLEDLGVVHKGMIPKLNNGFSALDAGVQMVTIGPFNKIGTGTQLVSNHQDAPSIVLPEQPLAQIAQTLLKQLIKIASPSKFEGQTANLLANSIHQLTGLAPFRKHHNVWAKNKFFDPALPTVLLCSHHDTVAPVKGWSQNPYQAQIEGNYLYGLGSNDAGGALVSLLATFYHYYPQKNLPYNLVFAAVAEEEISGPKGIQSILEELGSIDLAIIGEPTQMQLAVAEKGLMVVDATAQGKSGHAARKEGINAIEIAQQDIALLNSMKLERVSPLLGAVHIAVTQIKAGYQHNIVPDSCDFVIDIRSNECYSNEELFAILQTKLQSKIKARSFHLSSSGISSTHPIVTQATALGLTTFGSSTLSDQALLPFPSVKIGPGDSRRSHTADEYILLSEIEEGIQLYINLLNHLKL